MADVTLEMLQGLGACAPACEAFTVQFPQGTSYKELILTLAEHEDGIDWWEWLAPRVMALRTAWDRYQADTRPVWEQYEVVEHPAWERYTVVRRQSLEQYHAGDRQAYERYQADTRPAWEQYQADMRPALEQYEADTRQALRDIAEIL